MSKCKEEHHELQTSIWIDFIDNLPSIATRLILKKEDARDPTFRTIHSSDQIGTKNSRNLLSEQTLTNAHDSRHEGSRIGSRVVLTSEELRDPSLICENGSSCGVNSTLVVFENHGKNGNEGQIGSRCGSSCSNNSMSSNSQTERRDWIGIVGITHEKSLEKRYMPKQGCSEKKKVVDGLQLC